MESGEINKITHGKSDTGGGGIIVPPGKELVKMINNSINKIQKLKELTHMIQLKRTSLVTQAWKFQRPVKQKKSKERF